MEPGGCGRPRPGTRDLEGKPRCPAQSLPLGWALPEGAAGRSRQRQCAVAACARALRCSPGYGPSSPQEQPILGFSPRSLSVLPFWSLKNPTFFLEPWRVAPRGEQGCAEDRWGARVGCCRGSRCGSPGASGCLDFPIVLLPPPAALDVQKEAGHHDPNT